MVVRREVQVGELLVAYLFRYIKVLAEEDDLYVPPAIGLHHPLELYKAPKGYGPRSKEGGRVFLFEEEGSRVSVFRAFRHVSRLKDLAYTLREMIEG